MIMLVTSIKLKSFDCETKNRNFCCCLRNLRLILISSALIKQWSYLRRGFERCFQPAKPWDDRRKRCIPHCGWRFQFLWKLTGNLVIVTITRRVLIIIICEDYEIPAKLRCEKRIIIYFDDVSRQSFKIYWWKSQCNWFTEILKFRNLMDLSWR